MTVTNINSLNISSKRNFECSGAFAIGCREYGMIEVYLGCRIMTYCDFFLVYFIDQT